MVHHIERLGQVDLEEDSSVGWFFLVKTVSHRFVKVVECCDCAVMLSEAVLHVGYGEMLCQGREYEALQHLDAGAEE